VSREDPEREALEGSIEREGGVGNKRILHRKFRDQISKLKVMQRIDGQSGNEGKKSTGSTGYFQSKQEKGKEQGRFRAEG